MTFEEAMEIVDRGRIVSRASESLKGYEENMRSPPCDL